MLNKDELEDIFIAMRAHLLSRAGIGGKAWMVGAELHDDLIDYYKMINHPAGWETPLMLMALEVRPSLALKPYGWALVKEVGIRK